MNTEVLQQKLDEDRLLRSLFVPSNLIKAHKVCRHPSIVTLSLLLLASLILISRFLCPTQTFSQMVEAQLNTAFCLLQGCSLRPNALCDEKRKKGRREFLKKKFKQSDYCIREVQKQVVQHRISFPSIVQIDCYISWTPGSNSRKVSCTAVQPLETISRDQSI